MLIVEPSYTFYYKWRFFFSFIGNFLDSTDRRQEDVGGTIFWNGLILFGYPWNL